MRKFVLPITILLIIAFAVPLFTELCEKPLPEMERVTSPYKRVSLLLPKDAETYTTPECPVQEIWTDYFTVDFMEAGQASEDFPETEIDDCRANSSEGTRIERVRPDLIMSTHPQSRYTIALLKHPDGGVLRIALQFHDKILKDADFCARLRDAVIPSIQPGPAVRNLRERTETLDMQEAGIRLEIAVPQGFFTQRSYSARDYLNDKRPPYLSGMNLQWMRPATREGNTFFMGLAIRRDAPGEEDAFFADIPKREGVLLGQKIEWCIDKRGEHMLLINGIIPYGPKGWLVGVTCLCPEEDLPTFFSLVEGIKTTD